MEWSASSSALRYALDVQAAPPVLHLAGELDEMSVTVLFEGFAGVRKHAGEHLVLELSRLTFCSASGAGAVYQLNRWLEAEGVRLNLRNPHTAVRRVLELTGLSDVWELRQAVAAADGASAHRARLSAVLHAAMHAVGTSMGTAQYFDQVEDTLHLVAHEGFGGRFVSFFETVKGQDTSCGAAASDLRPVYVEDVTTSPIFVGHPELDVLVDAGVGSCASLPITTDAFGLLGVVSTHRPHPGPWSPADRDMLEHVQRHAHRRTAPA